MDAGIVKSPQDSMVQQLADHKGILHFGKAYHIRQPTIPIGSPEDCLCDCCALCHEFPPGPVPCPERREFLVGTACGSRIGPPVEKVLYIPEKYGKPVAATPLENVGEKEQQDCAGIFGQRLHIHKNGIRKRTKLKESQVFF